MAVAVLSIPRISIVTPCLNRVEFIEEAIESVLAQKYPLIEHIVVDGGSTDGTLQRLARYANLRVISEPDRGLYVALN
jgi:glycosyltransferase involved in cell wall biosynthesis